MSSFGLNGLAVESQGYAQVVVTLMDIVLQRWMFSKIASMMHQSQILLKFTPLGFTRDHLGNISSKDISHVH